MSIENLMEGVRTERSHLMLKETNRMEIDLMLRSDLSKAEWIKRYGDAFRRIIDNPELNIVLLDLYNIDPMLAENFIEERLKLAKPLKKQY